MLSDLRAFLLWWILCTALIPRASYLISARLPYLSIVEFYFINVQAVLCSVRSYMVVDRVGVGIMSQSLLWVHHLIRIYKS